MSAEQRRLISVSFLRHELKDVNPEYLGTTLMLLSLAAVVGHMHGGGGRRHMHDGRQDQRGDIRHNSFGQGAWT